MPRPNFSFDTAGAAQWHNLATPFNSTTTLTASRRSSETVSGVTRRKPVGWKNPTGYSMKRTDILFATGTCEGRYAPSNWGRYSGVVGGGGGRFNSLNHFDECVLESATDNGPAGFANLALIAARNNLKDMNVDLGTAFAERNQTARLIGDTASNLGKSFTDLLHGRTRSAMNRLGISSKKREPRGSNVPNKWLELQYGWKPLLMDVHGSAKALEGRQKSDWRVTAKGYKRLKNNWSVRRNPTPTTNFDACLITASTDASAMCRIDALPQNEAIISLASLGVLNPLNVFWERVPYSFVVDWIIPIGDFVSSLDALLGYESAYTSTSVKTETIWEDSGLSKTFTATTWTKNNYYGSKRIVKLVRTASSGVPMPRFPSIKDGWSLGHMANGLALLSTAFGRKR